MAEIQGTAKKVWPAEGKKPATVIVENGSGELRLSTFDAKLGAAVEETQEGSLVSVEYETQEKNGYTNHYIQNIVPVHTLDDEIVANLKSGNTFRNPVHPTEQASIHRAVALQRANEMLAYLPEDQRTMSSVKALYQQYLEILEGE